MMMKLLPTLALSLAATMTISGALITPALAQNAAVVNGKAIPKAKLDKLIANSGQGTNPELRERARDMLITRELINQEAIKRGLLANDNIQEQL
jgi:peptidyl-prolyl cis-trans isomerase C